LPVNDRIVAMHSRAVAGIQALINEHKYLIDNTEVGDPNRTQYPPTELKDMNAKLGICYSESDISQTQKLLMMQLQLKIESTEVADFVNKTIAKINLEQEDQQQGSTNDHSGHNDKNSGNDDNNDSYASTSSSNSND
jgi:hypothetical protein